MLLRSVNLNLLPTLRALLHERGVSRAANVLSMSQAAVSESLSQLRVLLDDPLLVRVGAQMELTPRAAELRDAVDRACDEIEGMLTKRVFDPALANRTFVISTNDHYVYLFGQEIIRSLGALAPQAEVHFVHWTAETTNHLASREVDLCLLPRFMIDDLSPASVKLKTMFSDRVVLMFDNTHPLARMPTVSESDLAPYRRVLFTMNEVVGKRRRSSEFRPTETIARVWPLLLGPLLLPGTDHLSQVPLSLAVRMARDLPLQWRDMPPSDLDVHCCMAWSTLLDADAGHRWFRTLVERAILSEDASRQSVDEVNRLAIS